MPVGNITIYPSIDGYVKRQAEGSWDLARASATGDAASSSSTVSSTALRASLTGPGRGSGYYVSRSFFSFDTRTISNTPESAIIRVVGYVTTAGDPIYCVKATSDIEAVITTADFTSIEGWSRINDNTSNVTYYADAISSWSTGANNFSLNSQALVDIAGGNSKFNICLLTERDLDDSGGDSPPLPSADYSGVSFVNHSTLSYRPFLLITQQDDSVFFGANF